MTVKKKSSKPAEAQPTSPTVEKVKKAVKKAAEKVAKEQGGKVTKEKPAVDVAAAQKRATDLATGKAKPRSPDQIKRDSMKPALEAKLKQDAENRSEQLLETGLVVIDPKDAKIPLEHLEHNAAVAKDVPEGLVEYQVQGTSVTLLGLRDSNATPTLAQRVAMARRLIEADGKLPKYVKSIQPKKPDFFNAEAELKKAPKAAAPAAEGKTSAPASTIPNGVPLKKICADINVDPKLARRILRSKGKKPGGRWEWEQKEVEGVKKLLAEEAKKLAVAGKE